ncbi:uncharacterized protein METZ01_LOCUS272685 [marine metagenome]|uniref:Uncharacterized protein n=1 Tax=marine metagenome TaxID=408172 RepID=A0A382KAT0_9ZZZZ
MMQKMREGQGPELPVSIYYAVVTTHRPPLVRLLPHSGGKESHLVGEE